MVQGKLGNGNHKLVCECINKKIGEICHNEDGVVRAV